MTFDSRMIVGSEKAVGSEMAVVPKVTSRF